MDLNDYRELLDRKAGEIRRAGREPKARALARELRQAAGLERRVALQAAADYLAGRSPNASIVRRNRSTRRLRGVMAVLGMAGAGLAIWFFGSLGSADYPRWFILLLLGLVGVNLLAWMLEPAAEIEFLHCAGCGQRRLADQKGRCPKCGSRKYRRPGLSKVALWAISAFFVGVAVFYLAGALQARHKNGRYLAEAAGWLLVAAMVVAGACGARVNKLLRYFSDLEFDADFDRLSRHPQLARRILILIMSVGVFVLAIQRLLSH